MFSTGYSSINNDITAFEVPIEPKDIETNRVVMLALDESLTSQYALEYAKENVIKPTDLVCILNCMPTSTPPPIEALDAGAMFIDSGYLQEQQKYYDTHSKFILKAYAKVLPKNKIRLFSVMGDNRDEIVRASKNLKVDLLVIGSRDHASLQRFFLGSTSDYCIHNMDCPVFVVKPPHGQSIVPILPSTKTAAQEIHDKSKVN